MCTPPAFAAGDTTELHEIVRQIWAANFLSANQTVSGQLPLPMFLAEADGERAIQYSNWRDQAHDSGLLSSAIDLQSVTGSLCDAVLWR